ncbi:hypothetical protein CRG98_023427 [Punica granatum]|uniref:DUF4219 domain-containing protein n=1 Tax=Punica granatum TaxID=22663 RepID=A0A2I0JJ05_PUNGR|nr:hypothetical protein CRG98_023427 [Punica granatum]
MLCPSASSVGDRGAIDVRTVGNCFKGRLYRSRVGQGPNSEKVLSKPRNRSGTTRRCCERPQSGTNYNTWKTCMESYLLVQDLWEIVGGSEATPHTDDAATLRKWKIKTGKAMIHIKVSVEEDMLEHIVYATMPKESWDIIAARFAKKNDMRLQL